jgi:hypothetical protein
MDQKEKRLRTQIRKLIRGHADIVIDELLQASPWHSKLELGKGYTRFSDDNNSTLSIGFGEHGIDHGDAYSMLYDPDLKNISFGQRWRTSSGGGENLCTRAAMIIMARGMQLDWQERPQDHRVEARKAQLQEEEETREAIRAVEQEQKE